MFGKSCSSLQRTANKIINSQDLTDKEREDLICYFEAMLDDLYIKMKVECIEKRTVLNLWIFD